MSDGIFQVGEGVVEITPPLGIEMAGFHKLAQRLRILSKHFSPAYSSPQRARFGFRPVRVR